MFTPASLRAHYSAFLAPGRVLLTGHSHQAWPDAARDGMLESLADAARLADDKWSAAFAVADEVRGYIAGCLGAAREQIALGPNTHELVLRFLSALELEARPHLVTTTGEFHSITRQLRRLAETKRIEVTWVEALPAATLSQRLAGAVTARTAAVLTSTVLYETSTRVPGLPTLIAAVRAQGAEVLLDAYHAFSIVPFTLASLGADDAFVVGGGYKYAQWGEGVCFLRVPPRPFRPVLTGWFAGFSQLAVKSEAVTYGAPGAESFAGSTYDPASHYRARAVLRFFQKHGMTLDALHSVSLRQTQRLIDGLDGFQIATPRAPEQRGGFVAIRVPRAGELVEALSAEGILTDSRGELLRLGPAPYLTDDELDRGIAAVRRLAR